mmetsp:Transcript_40246/g.64678  ORF Transcript_40246/g.64678 Transcript_40246/m.64678 type:complete len:87 (+) Transcript_40246:196-456(+)
MPRDGAVVAKYQTYRSNCLCGEAFIVNSKLCTSSLVFYLGPIPFALSQTKRIFAFKSPINFTTDGMTVKRHFHRVRIYDKHVAIRP